MPPSHIGTFARTVAITPLHGNTAQLLQCHQSLQSAGCTILYDSGLPALRVPHWKRHERDEHICYALLWLTSHQSTSSGSGCQVCETCRMVSLSYPFLPALVKVLRLVSLPLQGPALGEDMNVLCGLLVLSHDWESFLRLQISRAVKSLPGKCPGHACRYFHSYAVSDMRRGYGALTQAKIDPSRLRTSVKPFFCSWAAYLPLRSPAVQ